MKSVFRAASVALLAVFMAGQTATSQTGAGTAITAPAVTAAPTAGAAPATVAGPGGAFAPESAFPSGIPTFDGTGGTSIGAGTSIGPGTSFGPGTSTGAGASSGFQRLSNLQANGFQFVGPLAANPTISVIANGMGQSFLLSPNGEMTPLLPGVNPNSLVSKEMMPTLNPSNSNGLNGQFNNGPTANFNESNLAAMALGLAPNAGADGNLAAMALGISGGNLGGGSDLAALAMDVNGQQIGQLNPLLGEQQQFVAQANRMGGFSGYIMPQSALASLPERQYTLARVYKRSASSRKSVKRTRHQRRQAQVYLK